MAVSLILCGLLSSLTIAVAENIPPIPAAATPASPGDSLVWDALKKDQETKPGQTSAGFFFSVTNTASSDVVIDHVQTSCGCTVAKIPSQPWILKPGADGRMDVSVDLKGKSGTIYKTVTVFFTNGAPKQLTIQVVIPDSPEMVRFRNQQMAIADRQGVFKGDCARCHVEPTRGLLGKELFATACGICHESEHRASMVPNLHALNHSTDHIYWTQWISNGKAGTLMPAFAADQGGPLSADQIASLADYLSQSISPHPQPIPAANVEGIKNIPVVGSVPPPIPVK
ncbi:MAG: hypothetical protein JWR19_2060 [Pedosphaera sp.]|nr:hypothetical protein [Pedosphaera sp.]